MVGCRWLGRVLCVGMLVQCWVGCWVLCWVVVLGVGLLGSFLFSFYSSCCFSFLFFLVLSFECLAKPEN